MISKNNAKKNHEFAMQRKRMINLRKKRQEVTHDELLARIAKLSITPETNVVPSELATALMAVVELHRLDEYGDKVFCICEQIYPCETLKAIEEALNG